MFVLFYNNHFSVAKKYRANLYEVSSLPHSSPPSFLALPPLLPLPPSLPFHSRSAPSSPSFPPFPTLLPRPLYPSFPTLHRSFQLRSLFLYSHLTACFQ